MTRHEILDLAEDFHQYTDYETVEEPLYGGATNVTQHKIWAFTEEQLIKFARAILKDQND